MVREAVTWPCALIGLFIPRGMISTVDGAPLLGQQKFRRVSFQRNYTLHIFEQSEATFPHTHSEFRDAQPRIVVESYDSMSSHGCFQRLVDPNIGDLISSTNARREHLLKGTCRDALLLRTSRGNKPALVRVTLLVTPEAEATRVQVQEAVVQETEIRNDRTLRRILEAGDDPTSLQTEWRLHNDWVEAENRTL